MVWKKLKEIKGIVRGDVKETDCLFTNNIDDTQIMLKTRDVQKIFPMIKSAYENKKPFRFNLRGSIIGTFKRIVNTKTGKIQLQIRANANYVEQNYNPKKIDSCKQNYFEIYYPWDSLPSNLQKLLEKNKEVKIK